MKSILKSRQRTSHTISCRAILLRLQTSISVLRHGLCLQRPLHRQGKKRHHCQLGQGRLQEGQRQEWHQLRNVPRDQRRQDSLQSARGRTHQLLQEGAHIRLIEIVELLAKYFEFLISIPCALVSSPRVTPRTRRLLRRWQPSKS